MNIDEGVQSTSKRRIHRSWPQRIMHWTAGPEWCGNEMIPGDNLKIEMPMEGSTHPDGRYVYVTNNDGFELWMGTPHEWKHHMRANEARRLAWFILWTWWGKGTWFGLRRWIYYRALHAYVNRF